jgi:hypothetical protein
VNPSDIEASNRPAAAFAAAAAALVSTDDTLGIVTQLLLDAAMELQAAGAGLVIARPDSSLELLAATSHRAEELELFQLQSDAGPCVDAIRTGDTIASDSAVHSADTWPGLAAAFRITGFAALHAAPMRWHGHILGAVNFFWNTDLDTSAHAPLIRGYADVATIAIVHAEHVSAAQLTERTRAVLTSRGVIEQAKGVVAYRDRVDMHTAYRHLLHLATSNGVSLSTAAADVIEEAQRSERTD